MNNAHPLTVKLM